MEDNHKMDTLSECMGYLKKKGYGKEFMIDNGRLSCSECDNSYSPREVKIAEFYRFEGESDPADMQVLYAIESNDGLKGTLTDGYGAYSDQVVGDFVKGIQEIHKNDVY